MRNKLFLVIIGIVFILGAVIISGLFESEYVEPIADIELEEYFLFLGLDEFGEVRRTDTIIVAKLEDDGAKMLSIPRDLRVKFPDGSFHKINAAYGYPEIGGINLVRRLIADLLGVRVNAYMVADYRGVVELVDALGGVELDIQSAMYYEDSQQDLVIDLAAGYQTLDGSQAVDFLRYRGQTGDLGRIGRQQYFLESLGEKVSGASSVDQVTKLIPAALKHVQTNLSALDLRSLAEKAQSLTASDVQFATLPGRAQDFDDGNYFVESPVEVDALVDEFFHNIERETNSDISVIVVNGRASPLGRAGAVGTYSYLESQSFTMLTHYFADASDYPNSFIIDISGTSTSGSKSTKAQKLFATLSNVIARNLTPGQIQTMLLERMDVEELGQIPNMSDQAKAARLAEELIQVMSVSEFESADESLPGFGSTFAEGDSRFSSRRYDQEGVEERDRIATRFGMIRHFLNYFGDATLADPTNLRSQPAGAIDLMDADLLLIIGEGFPIQ